MAETPISTTHSAAAANYTWPKTVERVVICIGAQKAATSFLFKVLEDSDHVCTSPVKEVHFWDTLDGVDGRRFRRRARRQFLLSLRGKYTSHASRIDKIGRSEAFKLALARHLGARGIGVYKNFMLSAYRGEPVIFEASPGYSLCSPKTFAKMGRLANDVRLVFLLRDPVDRLWSASKYIWRKRLENGEASEDDVYRFFESRVNDRNSIGYRHSDYQRSLENIRAAGMTERLTVLFQENLRGETEQSELAHAIGFRPTLDLQEKVNTHSQHFELGDDLKDRAVHAFKDTYRAVRDAYGSRVPDDWYG